MNTETLRIALSAPEAWKTLTDPQAEAVVGIIVQGSVAATARSLGITRQAVLDRLRHAASKFLDFAKAIEEAGEA